MPSNPFRKHLYFTIIFILTILVLTISLLTGVGKMFLDFYKVNHVQINGALISFFGVLFGLLFTSMAIIFSIGKESMFMKLVEESGRAKKDVVNYFISCLIPIFFVIILSLFFIITSNPLSKFFIYALYYLIIFSFINIIIFLVTFILILKN